jgi:hypothetical protein
VLSVYTRPHDPVDGVFSASVDAEDALIAALKVKVQRPEALIAYVRQQNKRGDTRHPMRRLSSESR